MIGTEPGIRAASFESFDDALIDSFINEIFAGLTMNVESDGYAPCALAADDPVGATFDH